MSGEMLLWNRLDATNGVLFESSFIAALSPSGKQIAMLIDNVQLRLVSCDSATSDRSFGQILVSVDTECASSFLRWSPSGSKLGLASSHGKFQMLSALGVSLSTLDISKQMKSISNFYFLSDTLLLVLSEDGNVSTINILLSALSPLASLSRLHAKSQLFYSPINGLFVCAGLHPQSQEMNVSLWKMADDQQSCTMLDSLLDPVSWFNSWMMTHTQKDNKSCSACFSPQEDCIVILSQAWRPMVLDVSKGRLISIQFPENVQEIFNAGTDACYWSDNVLVVMLTEMKKMVFIQMDAEIKILQSEDVLHETWFVGRLLPRGLLFWESGSSSQREARVGCLKQESPLEHLETLLEKQNFSEALQVAEIFSLPQEGVYKKLWKHKSYSSISSLELEIYFENIMDLDWVTETCLSISGETIEDQEDILNHGTHSLQKHLNNASKIVLYLKFLKQKEMLNAFKALHPGRYSSEAFHAFRSEEPLTIARAFAENANIKALQILMKHFAWYLIQHLPTLLHAVPATVNPRECSQLYPVVGMTPHHFKFVSSLDASVLEPLQPLEQILQDRNLLANSPGIVLLELEKTEKIKNAGCFTEQQLQDFYLKESERIEQETGDLEHAIEVLECGIKKGIKAALSSKLQKLKSFHLWMKTGCLPWDLDSHAFSQLTAQQMIQNCLDLKSDDEVMETINDVLIPLGSELTVSEKQDFQETLFSYVLQRDILFFEELISKECQDGTLFGTNLEDSHTFLKMAVKTIQSMNKISNWKILTEIIDLMLKQFTLQWSDHRINEDPVFVETRSSLEICKTGEMFEKYGVMVEYMQIATLDQADCVRLMDFVLAHAIRNGHHWSSNQWDQCFLDLIHISQTESSHYLAELSNDFFQTLLRAGQFTQAEDFMKNNLDDKTAEEISWKIGHELMYSITDLESTSALGEAIDCFRLFPSSSRANKEIKKLRALLFLKEELHVAIIPVELEQLKSKSVIFEQIIQSSKKQYLYRDSLLNLTMELDLTDDEFLESWKILCRSALAEKDLHEAKSIVQELNSRKMREHWILASEVLEANKRWNLLTQEEEQELWVIVIAHCDGNLQDQIHQMKKAFPDRAFSYSEFTNMKRYPNCEDVLYFCVDKKWRDQLKGQQDYSMCQKWKVYDFVHTALESVENKDSDSSLLLQKLLESSPQSISAQLGQRPNQEKGLELGWDALLEQDHLQSNFQQIQAWLPALNHSKFCNEESYRHQVIIELARYSGELLYRSGRKEKESFDAKGNWEEAWSLALEQGSTFKMDTWDLYRHFAISLASLVDCPFTSIELVMESLESHLALRKTQFVQELLNEAWDEATTAYGVAFVLCIIARMAERPKTDFLNAYATLIMEWNEGFDFRIPILKTLQEFLAEEFEFDFEWTSPSTEMQSLYGAVQVSNFDKFAELYQILEDQDSSRQQTRSMMSIGCVIKELLASSWDTKLYSQSFWRTLLSSLLLVHLQSLMDFLVLLDSKNLIENMDWLDEDLIERLSGWNPEEEEVRRIQKIVLELVQECNISELEQKQWRKELKRIKIKEASQNLDGMESIITSDNFDENLPNLMKRLIVDQTSFPQLMNSVQEFCRNSDEAIAAEHLLDHFQKVITRLTELDEMKQAVACLDCLPCEEWEMVESTQQHLWTHFIDALKSNHQLSKAQEEHLLFLSSIVHGEIWRNKKWSILQQDLWILFSLDTSMRLNAFSEDDALVGYKNFSSMNDIESFVDKLFAENIHTSVVYKVLEILQLAGKVLAEDLPSHWLHPYYSRCLTQDFDNRDFDSILNALIHARYHIDATPLDQKTAEKLFSDVSEVNVSVAISIGLLLPDKDIHERVETMLQSSGDAQTLITILESNAKICLSRLFESAEWFKKLLQECPPHPHLCSYWVAEIRDQIGEVEQGGVQEEGIKEKEEEEGWDFQSDDEMEEMIDTEKGSGGWSDVDELETALNEADESKDVAKVVSTENQTSESLTTGDCNFLVSCCFPSVLARFIREDRTDLAAKIISEKFGLHDEMHGVTGGQSLLKKLFKQLSSESNPSQYFMDNSRDYLWSTALLHHLLDRWMSLSCEALDRLAGYKQNA